MLHVVDRVGFGVWLKKEREIRGWTQSDLARRSGLNRAIINKFESGVSLPSVESFIALSDALYVSPIHLFRQAGLLSKAPKKQVALEDWDYYFSQLSLQDQEELTKLRGAEA